MVSHRLRERAIKRQLGRVERELDSTRDRLKAMRRELEATRRELRSATGASDERSSRPAPSPGKLRAIDYAVERLGIESFASLEIGQALGQYAFHAIDQPGVRRGAVIDVLGGPGGDRLLDVIEQAAERPGMRVLDGSFSASGTIAEIGQVDAVLLFDVLHRMVDPDWDRVLELFAPITSCFVIANPQWERDEATVRLIDLGREKFLEAVPPWPGHKELFDRLDEWHAPQQRPYRDVTQVWQWGITDADLKATIGELGFSLEREWSLNPHPEADGFLNKAFVFKRAEPSGAADGSS